MLCPPLSFEECRRAIFHAAPNKAPGPNGILALAIRWAWEVASETIFLLFRACVQIGHHPDIWHESIAVALCKPNKKDYSLPRSYRLIQLLDCLGKALEFIQAQRLMHV
ncbi:hypothetical protein K474DRAFT_1603352, partial [Panus rudis PR-1116 ss-1]